MKEIAIFSCMDTSRTTQRTIPILWDTLQLSSGPSIDSRVGQKRKPHSQQQKGRLATANKLMTADSGAFHGPPPAHSTLPPNTGQAAVHVVGGGAFCPTTASTLRAAGLRVRPGNELAAAVRGPGEG